MELKPQDTLLVLKYWSLNQSEMGSSVRSISEAIGISASEVSKGSKRLISSHLVVERSGRMFAEKGALVEWLNYGVRYAYPQENTGYGRGMATSWNCPVLVSEVSAPIPPLVWAVPAGEVEGAIIKPIHNSVPLAASRDEGLYRIMSIVEAIRGGKPRELAIARDLLASVVKGNL